MVIERWDFNLGEDNDRLTNLETSPPFDEICDRIRNSMNILCSHADLCKDQQGFARPIYCIEVWKSLFDLFFNSKNGYRAQYYCSEKQGIKGNEFLIRTVLPELLEFNLPLKREFTLKSLQAQSSKVWVAEIIREYFCPKCFGEWKPNIDRESEIMNDRWENSIEDDKSVWGRKAPYFTKIKIFGGFLNLNYEEFVPEHKKDRSLDIHKYGWS